MKKLYFETKQALVAFIELCKTFHIKYVIPPKEYKKGHLNAIEIPDTLETDEFLEKTGY